jgi:hypothetical protein
MPTNNNVSGASSILGQRIALKRAKDRPCQCGCEEAIVAEGKGPHAALLHCAQCDRHRGWLPSLAAAMLVEVKKKFGSPLVTIKDAAASPGADAEATLNDARNCNPRAGERAIYMANVDEMCGGGGGKYHRAADIDDALRAKILDVDFTEFEETAQDGRKYKQTKPVLSLSTGKKLVCNQTNKGIAIKAWGTESDNWIGKTIELFTVMTSNGKAGIQIRIVKPKAKPETDPDLDDDIPES